MSFHKHGIDLPLSQGQESRIESFDMTYLNRQVHSITNSIRAFASSTVWVTGFSMKTCRPALRALQAMEMRPRGCHDIDDVTIRDQFVRTGISLRTMRGSDRSGSLLIRVVEANQLELL